MAGLEFGEARSGPIGPRSATLSDPFRITVSTIAYRIAFWFWFFLGAKTVLIFLFFNNQPRLGTLTEGGIVVVFATLLVVVVLAKSVSATPRRRRRWSAVLPLIAAYLVWSGISFLWSSPYSMVAAAGYWGKMAGEVFVVYLLFTLDDAERILVASFKGIIAAGVLMSLVALTFAGRETFGRLGAEFLHPNSLGKYLGMAMLVCIYLAWQRRSGGGQVMIWGASFFILGIAFFLAMSKGAVIAFAFAVLVYNLLGQASIIRKIVFIILGTISVYLTYDYAIQYIEFYFYEAGGGRALETLTGRTMLWADTWEMILANPILGYGFLSFRSQGPQIFSVTANTAHNELLQQWFTLGIPGVALTVLIYATHFWQLGVSSIRGKAAVQSRFALSMFVYFVVQGLVSAAAVGLRYPLPLLLLIAYTISQIATTSRARADAPMRHQPASGATTSR